MQRLSQNMQFPILQGNAEMFRWNGKIYRLL